MKYLMILGVLLHTLFLSSCFGPLNPYDPAPDQEDTSGTNGTSSGLVGYWKCNDSAVVPLKTLEDEAGNSAGTVSGAVIDSGIDSTGLYFDGSDDMVAVAPTEDSLFDFKKGDFTVALWVRPAIVKQLPDSGIDIIASGIARQTGFAISIRDSAFTAYVGTSTSAAYAADIDAADGKWHHVVLLRRSYQVELYVDGKKILSFSNNSSVSTGGNLIIGDDASTRTDNAFSGYLDEIKIFDSAWSAAAVRSAYESLSNNI